MASKLKRRERFASWTITNSRRVESSRAKCIGDGEVRWIGDGKARNGDGETRIGDGEAGFVTVFAMVRLGLRWCLQWWGWVWRRWGWACDGVCDGEARFGDGESENRWRWESELVTVRNGFNLFTIWKYREKSFLWELGEWGKFNKTKRGWITFLV